MPRDSRIRRARLARLALAESVTDLGAELNKVLQDGSLSNQGKAERGALILEEAQAVMARRTDELREMVRDEVTRRRQALDEHLMVDDDKVAVRAAVYQSLLARAHDHPDQLLRVLEDQYGDPIARRLLTDTLNVVIASSDDDAERLLRSHIEAIQANGRGKMSERERELQAAVDAAAEFSLYVDMIVTVTHSAAREIAVTPSGIRLDMHSVEIWFTRTEPAFERYELHGQSVTGRSLSHPTKESA